MVTGYCYQHRFSIWQC